MKKLLTFTLVCTFSSLLWAQKHKVIDSLHTVVSQDISDKEKVDALEAIATQYSNYSLDSTTKYAERAINLADQIGYLEGKMFSLERIGWAYMINGNLTKAETFYNRVLALAEEIDHKRGKADAFNGLGQIKNYQGDIEKALEYFLRTLKLNEELSHIAGVASSHNNIALIYGQKGEYEEAVKHYLQTLKIRIELDDKPNIALVSTNIGTAYHSLGDLEKSLKYHKDAVRIAEEVGYTRVMAMGENNLGSFYSEAGDYTLAVEHLNRSVELIEEMGAEANKMYPYMILGRIYQRLGDLEKSKKYTVEALQFAQSIGNTEYIREGAEQLAVVEKELGNYQKAYEAHVLFKKMTDSLNNADVTRRLTRLEADYEFQKERDSIQFQNQKELFAKNSEIERSRLLFFVAIVIGLMLLTVGYLIARSRIKSKAMQAKSLKEISDFKESMTGMIAHDLKNPLSLILNSKDARENQQMARQMLQLINNMLDVQRLEAAKMKLRLESISFGELIESLEKQLVALLKEKNLRLECTFMETDVLADKPILERILTNLLTNAIKFSPANEVITVTSEVVDAHVRISVSDKGKGIAKDDQEKIFESFEQAEALASGGVGSTGLGLTFCKLAVEAHGSELKLDSVANQGATFYFELEKAEGGKETTANDRPERSFTISPENQLLIKNQVEELQNFQLYQIGEIESQLESLKGISADVDLWVEEVLNAAYNGNKSHYDELLEMGE